MTDRDAETTEAPPGDGFRALLGRGARRGLRVLTGVFVFAAVLTALGGELEIRLRGARLKVGGFERPFVLSLVLLGIVGLLRHGWIRTLLSPPGEAVAGPRAELGRRLRAAACWIAVLVVLSPLVLDPSLPWPKGADQRIGFVVVGAIAALYVWLARLGLFPSARRGAGRLDGIDLGLLVAFPLYVLLIGNGEVITSGDNLATRSMGPRLLKEGTLDLEGSPFYRQGHYSGLPVGKRILPSFPLGTGLLSLPYSAVALAGSRGVVTGELINRWEKQFSALLTVASTILLLLGVRRRFGELAAVATAAVFALGTTAFTCAGQAMYSTTGEVFFLALALFLLLPENGSDLRLAGAGLAVSGAFLCRPTAVVPAAVLGLVLLLERRRGLRAYALSAAAAAGAVCLGLQALYGHPLGGYGLMNTGEGVWGTHVVGGLLGNLFSPSRGLLPHFPYVLLVPLAFARSRRDAALWPWFLAATLATGATVFLASIYSKWWGGYSIGPRLLTEAAPFLALLTLPLWVSWARLGRFRGALVATVGLAMATQLLGAYNTQANSWNGIVSTDEAPEVLWSIRNSQLAATWVPGWRMSIDPPSREIDGEPSRWHRIDLSGAANSRYDLDPFWPAAPEDAFHHYPRIEPAQFNLERSLFHFAPPGKPNAVTTCRRTRPDPIPVPGLRAGRIHAILAAGATRGLGGPAVIASWEVRYADGSRELLPIRLNRDAFEYLLAFRAEPIPRSRLYWGLPDDPDALVHSTFAPTRSDLAIRALGLVNADAESDIGVSLLALTLEDRQGEPVGGESGSGGR